jgi:hypothetical protein
MSRLFRTLVALSERTAETYRIVWASEEARLTAAGRGLRDAADADAHRRDV